MSEENKELENEETLEETQETSGEETALGKVAEKVTAEKEKEAQQAQIDLEALKKEIAEAIRKEEKDKLYPSMTKLKEEKEAAEKRVEEAMAKIKEYEDSSLSAEEKTQKRLEELLEANKALEDRLEAVANASAKEIYETKLESHKDKLLAQYGDEIVVDLVTGSTIEELTESAEKAHSVYKEIQERAIEAATKQKKKEPVGTGVAPGKADSKRVSEVDLDKISEEEFWKIKDKLLQEAMKS